MKRILLDFLQRGLIASGFGPMIVAVIYLLLERHKVIDVVTINEMSIAIFTSAALAFVAGSTNVIYQIENLPLMLAILIHGVILYVSYLAVYLINGWLKWGTAPILIFTVIFLLSYFVIWAIIYFTNRMRTAKLNARLRQNQQPSPDISRQ